MDNTNNKNVFSLKLFWQTVIQLKVIGFISLAVVAFVSGFPIIIEGLNIKKNDKCRQCCSREWHRSY